MENEYKMHTWLELDAMNSLTAPRVKKSVEEIKRDYGRRKFMSSFNTEPPQHLSGLIEEYKDNKDRKQ